MGEARKERERFILAFLFISISVILVRIYVFSICIVSGVSMQPTLNSNDIVLLDKITPLSKVDRGTIIVFKDDSGKSYVKRVIGLPQDVIEIKDSALYVNDEVMIEPYLSKDNTIPYQTMDDMSKVTVPEGYYFVAGDNRVRSYDSRNGLGLAEGKNITGRSIGIIPLSIF